MPHFADDPDFILRLLEQHGRGLRLYAAQWSTPGDGLSPEDMVQEALLELMRQPRFPQHVVAWLYRVVRNRGLAARRSSTRRRHRETQAAGKQKLWFEPSNWSALEAQEVCDALQTLDPELREVVVAHLWGHLTFDEIAAVTGCSASTAHRRYREAIHLLKIRLDAPCPKNR